MFLALTFAFFASFADQKLYAPPVGFTVRVQFTTPEQAAHNDVESALFRPSHTHRHDLLAPELRAEQHQDRQNFQAKSQASRVGKVVFSTCRSRWAPCHKKKKHSNHDKIS